jgi:hypothetical protein
LSPAGEPDYVARIRFAEYIPVWARLLFALMNRVAACRFTDERQKENSKAIIGVNKASMA